MITSLEATTGEAYDGHHFCPLVDYDLKQKLPQIREFTTGIPKEAKYFPRRR